MKRLIFLLTACFALFSCTKEPSLYDTSWHGEVIDGNSRKIFDIEFDTATCFYVYTEYENGDIGPSYSQAVPGASYTFSNPNITIEYFGATSFMGPGDQKQTDFYPNITGTLKGDTMELTVRGTVFSLKQ